MRSRISFGSLLSTVLLATVLLSAMLLTASAHGAPPTASFAPVPESSPGDVQPTPVAPLRPVVAAPRTPTPPPQPGPHGESWATRSARLMSSRGQLWQQRREPARAATAFMQAIRMDPSYGPAYLGLAGAREQLGDPAEAERIYTLALRLRGTTAEALTRRARLRNRLGRREAAIVDLQAAVDRTPGHIGRAELLATWYVQAQSWAAALGLWRQVLAVHRQSGDRTAGRRAELQCRALSVLASELDPVTTPPTRSGWIRRSLARIGRRGG